MPKSKVRKKTADASSMRAEALAASVRPLPPSPTWYPISMAVVLVVGLAWLVVYYLTNAGTDPRIGFMAVLGAWNFAIGFGVMLAGLIMAVKWR